MKKTLLYLTMSLIALTPLVYWITEELSFEKVEDEVHTTHTETDSIPASNSSEITHNREQSKSRKYEITRSGTTALEVSLQKSNGEIASDNYLDLSSEQQFDQLLELDQSLGNGREKFKILMAEYDQNIGDTELEEQLSSAMLNDKEYRENMIKKFKIERELATLK